MANRNECFSDFYKQRTAKERWHSLVSRMGDRETPLSLPLSLYGRAYGRSYADVITKFSRLDVHSGQTTEHAHDLSTSGATMWCSNTLYAEQTASVCMRGDLRQNYVSNCVMQNLQFLLLAIKLFSKETGTAIEIPQKKWKKQNRI